MLPASDSDTHSNTSNFVSLTHWLIATVAIFVISPLVASRIVDITHQNFWQTLGASSYISGLVTIGLHYYGRQKYGPPWFSSIGYQRPHLNILLSTLICTLLLASIPGLIRSIQELFPGQFQLPQITFSRFSVLDTIALIFIGPWIEEFVFRGLLWDALSKIQSVTPPLTIIISTLLFTVAHTSLSDTTLGAIAYVLLSGLILGLARVLTRSLWPGILAHSIHNFAFYYLLTFSFAP